MAVEAQDQVQDWSVSIVSRLPKLINKYWLDTVSIHLKPADDTSGPMLAFKCNHDYFVVRQLMTDIDVSMLQDALNKDKVGSFVVDGVLLKNKARMLDLAKSDINIEVAKNTLRFYSSYASRGNNDVKVILDSMESTQPQEKFLRDLLKRAIGALDVPKVQGEWVPFDDDATNHFLRFVDADLPHYRAVLVTPIQ